MKKLTILVDMDDTLINLGEMWVKTLNERYGTSVKPEDVTEWDITKFFPRLTKSEVFEILHTPEVWSKTTPLRDAVKYIEKLQMDGHKIVVVTSAPPKTVDVKLRYSLFRHFPFTYKDVVIAYQKNLIKGDIMIDDAPHNLEGIKSLPILVTAPHNLDYEAEENGMLRANNWKEIYDYICEIADVYEKLESED